MSKIKYTPQQFKADLPCLVSQKWEFVHTFLKSRKVINNTSLARVFWQSSLPIIHFDCLAKEQEFESYLLQYFSKDGNSNETFLKLFLNAKKNVRALLKSCIKQQKAFDKQSHFLSFDIFALGPKEFKNFYAELEYIINLYRNWEAKSNAFLPYLYAYSYEEIIINSIAYYEKIKRRMYRTDFSEVTVLEFECIQVLEMILSQAEKQDKAIFEKRQFDYFKKFALPPIWSSVNMETFTEPEEEIDDRKMVFRNLFDFYRQKNELEFHLDLYLSGYAEFEIIEGFKANLRTTDSFIAYRKSLDKGKYDDTFFANSLVNDENLLKDVKRKGYASWEAEIELAVAADLAYFDFYEIKLKSNIDLYKLLKLTKALSLLLMPQRRSLLRHPSGRYELKRKLPANFRRLFQTDYLVSFSKESLIRKLRKYFHFPVDEIEKLLDFLTLDLTKERKRSIDITANPLIKIGDLYIWPAAFLRDRRWSVVLHRKFVAEGLLLHQAQSEKLEAKVSSWFKNAGYSAISSYVYEDEGRNGEIDVLAYKDNTLFIIELKTTYIVEDVITTSRYYKRNFKSKASDQLDKAIEYVKANFDAFQNDSNLGVSCKLENIELFSLVLSNSYVSDETIFNNKHLKLSMFELMIILKNDLYEMLYTKQSKLLLNREMDLPTDFFTSRSTGSIKPKEELDLWNGQQECSAGILIDAIKKNKVYEHMDHYASKFSNVEIELDKFSTD